jgi:hypothetical protein
MVEEKRITDYFSEINQMRKKEKRNNSCAFIIRQKIFRILLILLG